MDISTNDKTNMSEISQLPCFINLLEKPFCNFLLYSNVLEINVFEKVKRIQKIACENFSYFLYYVMGNKYKIPIKRRNTTFFQVLFKFLHFGKL